MQERINLAQWDNDNDPQMIKKIKDMNNMWNYGERRGWREGFMWFVSRIIN